MGGRNDGGPAYPVMDRTMKPIFDGSHEVEVEYMAKGMSLRDYFAAKIIAAIVAMQDDEPLRIEEGDTVREAMTRAWAGTAETAYAAADAMLAAREGRA